MSDKPIKKPLEAKKMEVAERRLEVSRLLRKNMSAADIGRKLGISRQLARNDIRVILKQYDEEINKTSEWMRAKEIHKLDEYEKDLHEGFQKYRIDGKYELAARVYDRIHKAIELRAELESIRKPRPDFMTQNQMSVQIQGYEYEGGSPDGQKPGRPQDKT